MNKPLSPKTVPPTFSWLDIDTVLLDMDGTLLDKYFDDYFWEKYVPEVYAKKHDLSQEDTEKALLERYRQVESTLQWTDLDYWTEQLGLDIPRLKTEIDHLINVHPHVIPFLQFVRSHAKKLCLVTNAHPKTLDIKMNKAEIAPYFDQILCSDEVGEAKEHIRFWQQLPHHLDFDKERTMFADDTVKVLRAAGNYGIKHLVHVARPSSKLPVSYSDEFHSIAGFNELIEHEVG